MKILIDRHHQALYSSLIKLLEERLGHECYCQIGMEWWDNKFWNIYPSQDTAMQYLSLNQRYKPLDGTNPLNNIVDEQKGVFTIIDPQTGKPIKAVTLEAFKLMQFDAVIASIPEHIEPFKKLIAQYQPNAKLIFQIGNAWNIPNNSVRNVMASANCLPPVQVNYVQYHQEFDLNLFNYTSPPHNLKVYSFINCLGTDALFKKDWELFLELERLMPGWEFKSFGGQCRDGYFGGDKAVADKMKEADFIYMVKSGGDGYGHNIFSAAACGRPIITRLSDYKGKLAEPLINEKSSITVDNKTADGIGNEIWSSDIDAMSQAIYQAFKDNVDFDKEQVMVEQFLSRLI